MKIHPFPSLRRTSAFTLIELLVSIAIVLILAALIFVASHKVMQTARNTQNVANLKTLSAAGLQYAMDNEMQLPGSGNPGYMLWDLDILQQLNPAADIAAAAGTPGRLAAEMAAKPFNSPFYKVRVTPPGLPRAYTMNAFLVNLWGVHPAYPGALWDTPARLPSIPAHSKVWFLGDAFFSNEQVIGTAGGHIWGGPFSADAADQLLNASFLDGHVETVDLRDPLAFWVRHSDPQTAGNY